MTYKTISDLPPLLIPSLSFSPNTLPFPYSDLASQISLLFLEQSRHALALGLLCLFPLLGMLFSQTPPWIVLPVFAQRAFSGHTI